MSRDRPNVASGAQRTWVVAAVTVAVLACTTTTGPSLDPSASIAESTPSTDPGATVSAEPSPVATLGPSAEPTSEATPSIALPAFTWTRHVLPGLEYRSVLTRRGRYFAVGPARGDRGDEMSVLTSDDGLSWRTLARRPFDGQFPMSMALVGDHLIVLAALHTDPEGFRTVVWSSEDGKAWEVWVKPEGTRHPRHFARIGSRWLMQSEYGGGIQSSLDGVDWTTEVRLHPGARGPGFVVGPAGVLTPLTTEQESGRNRTAMHLTADGREWSDTVLEEGNDVRLDAAGANQTVYVAIGVVRAPSNFPSIAWWSRDGVTWERSEIPDDFGASQYFAEDIISYARGFIATVNPYDEGPPRILWSNDGRAWEYVDGGPDVLFGGTGLLADSRRLLYFGSEPTSPEMRTLWEATPSD